MNLLCGLRKEFNMRDKLVQIENIIESKIGRYSYFVERYDDGDLSLSEFLGCLAEVWTEFDDEEKKVITEILLT